MFQQKCVKARALYDNIAEAPDELAFRKGDVLTVLEQNTAGLEGWWLCALRGRQVICLLRLTFTFSTRGWSYISSIETRIFLNSQARKFLFLCVYRFVDIYSCDSVRWFWFALWLIDERWVNVTAGWKTWSWHHRPFRRTSRKISQLPRLTIEQPLT